jgi:hypothetical protein
MYIQKRHWLDYDPVAFAALVIGIGMIELLALIIWRHGAQHTLGAMRGYPMRILRTLALVSAKERLLGLNTKTQGL